MYHGCGQQEMEEKNESGLYYALYIAQAQYYENNAAKNAMES